MRSVRRLTPALVLALVLALPGLPVGRARADPTPKIDPSLLAAMTADPLKPLPIIVEMDHASAPFAGEPNVQLAQQAVTLLNANGQAVGALSLIDSAAGWAPSAGIQAISTAPGVAFIHQDATVHPDRAPPGPTWPSSQLTSLYPQETHADRVWSQGGTGAGVTVAVLDSGVAADVDLVQPSNRLLATVSFAGVPDPSRPDPGGHGTHVAGIVAGSGVNSAYQYVGMAPAANIVGVRVLDANGNGRLSSVIRGIEWVLAHRWQYNIRVINLSFGAPPPASYRADPLSAAVEIAWKAGLVVVAAAGNGGPNGGTVISPGVDPYVITVGATDDQGTLTLTDDALAWFSAWGTPTGGRPKPDLVAPGRRLVSIRVRGSTLDTMLPDHIVTASNGATYMRLTGTSQATAAVSGAAAALVARAPWLGPDQVKTILVSSTQPFGPNGSPPLPSPTADGSGLLDDLAAYTSAPRSGANTGLRPADGLARSLYPALYSQQPLAWIDPTADGILWSALTWTTVSWTNIAWDNIAWDTVNWSNIAWDNIAWDTTTWDNIAWDKSGWDNIAWDNIAWD